MLTPQLEEVVPEDEPVVVAQLTEPAWFDVDDLLERRERVDDFENFVRLLLVFGEMDLGSGVRQQVLDFGGGVGRVEPNGDPASRDRRDVEDHPFRSIFGVNRDAVAYFEAERDEPVGGESRRDPRSGPR
jgi:hypothetical protein